MAIAIVVIASADPDVVFYIAVPFLLFVATSLPPPPAQAVEGRKAWSILVAVSGIVCLIAGSIALLTTASTNSPIGWIPNLARLLLIGVMFSIAGRGLQGGVFGTSQPARPLSRAEIGLMAACGVVLIAIAEMMFPHDPGDAFSVLVPFGTWLAATGFALEVLAAALVGNKPRVERAISPVVALSLSGLVYLWLQGVLFFR